MVLESRYRLRRNKDWGLVVTWPGVTVVVPVYRSSTSLMPLLSRLSDTLSPLGPFEVILVDDGSANETWRVIGDLTICFPELVGLRLGRNFGQHNALLAGIRESSFPVTVTIDDDLQNPPEEIPKLVAKLLSDDLDVVYGAPERVAHSWFRRIAGRATRQVLRGGLGVTSAPEVSSFRAFRTVLRDAFAEDLGSSVSLDALLAWGSSRFGTVRVHHEQRHVGKSNYTFGRLLRFGIDTITGYSAVPLQIAGLLGIVTAFFGLVILVFVTFRFLTSGVSVPGFPFLASTIAIFSGAQLLALGIIGEYLARMHFRIMRKPTYVVRDRTRQE